MAEKVINIENLKKVYKIYPNTKARVLDAFHIGRKKDYEEFHALEGVSFHVERGETMGIIGNNGAGKSTLLKIITGVLEPTEGNVSVNGKISALLELGAGFNEEFTGLENIYLNGRIMGYTRKEMDARVNAIIEFADIGDFLYQPVKSYSSGMFARLAFSVAINVEPDILIVDEALSVGDVFFQNKCFNKFAELKEKGVTILFVSHDLNSIRQMCSKVLWLEHGEPVFFGSSAEGCDRYLDDRRKDSTFVSGHLQEGQKEDNTIASIPMEGRKAYPLLQGVEDRFNSDYAKIRSVFFTDEQGNVTDTHYVDQEYTAHIVVECLQDVTEMIIGFILTNDQGIPPFDINNFINQQEVIEGKKGQVLEVMIRYSLPRIREDEYIISATIAKGSMAKHEVLTWLHDVMRIQVKNAGWNASLIELPEETNVFAYSADRAGYLQF